MPPMSFFESFTPPPVPPGRSRRQRPMPWFMPGDNIMSATMPIDRLLIHRPALAVYAGECRVYPYGFVFSVTVVRRWPDEAPRIPAAPLNPFGMLGPLHETGHEK